MREQRLHDRAPRMAAPAGCKSWHHGRMLVAPFAHRSIEDALSAVLSLVAVARAEREICFAASLIEGPAVILGQHQRASRVVDLPICGAGGVRVLRRRTSGTAMYVGQRALLFSLVLPHVAALFADASPRTLLNRNLRPFLRGLTAAGGVAHYFGREWVTVRKRPALTAGFDMEADGAVIVEALAGIESSMAVPRSLFAADEHAVERFRGQSPAGLVEVLPETASPGVVARCVTEAFTGKSRTKVTLRGDLLSGARLTDSEIDAISSDPVPLSAELRRPVHIPIGWLERAELLSERGAPGEGPRRLWLGGDILAPRALLDAVSDFAAGAPPETVDLDRFPLEGVTLSELLSAARFSHPTD